MTTRLLLVDDHAVVRSGLKMLLSAEQDVEIVGEAGTAADAIEWQAAWRPDVILMDIGLPDLSGIEATREIKKRFPKVAVVALTIHEDEEYFFKMLDAGASGYVPKRAAPEELLTAIRAAASGEVYLYPSLAKLLVRDYLKQDAPARENQLWTAHGPGTAKCSPTLQKAPATRRLPLSGHQPQDRRAPPREHHEEVQSPFPFGIGALRDPQGDHQGVGYSTE